MELDSVVYSTLAFVFSFILIFLVVSYIGYKIKQGEEPPKNPSIKNYHELETHAIISKERN